MNNKIVQADHDKTIICEANGCHLRADFRVILRVGSKGQVTFFLCKKCKPNFSTDHNNCIRLDKGPDDDDDDNGIYHLQQQQEQ